ncbi:PEP-CTERM sorting domain-containing protein [Paucibacter sp. PLA-PC-4]|uniref:PEP-CTERM sorting domain-containing protein n=1 Tax=Paucibacter sp. PLA-PC-4 TaxID=2993655 RepID=UPI00224B4A81|nr:PEP-CTERM sorting domain-containing protein [Paucibacter sp. PLA-PC-4]MCX2864248.1 PEP-CTERM sorting domain-containing protein [Paucibacter sp. PLA-PC-4]
MFQRLLMAVALATALAPAGAAEQFEASAHVFNGNGYGQSYLGAGGTTPLYNQALGQVVDGGNGAFDAFGFYNSGVGALSQTRQVELLSGNVFRFFDTFTNHGASSITTTLNFFGNLGSDGDELVSAAEPGLLVSCEDDGSGSCGSDPVLALVSGNNGLGQATITPDRYNVSFSVTVKPGESLSLLNFAFLASDVNGPTVSDLWLAQSTGAALLSAPRLDGLSTEQVASIANFTTPVPEPTTWAMLAMGLGLLALRRSRA